MGPSTAAACCLQWLHTIHTHPGGVSSAKCFFCPWWPWPLTLTFELGRGFCTVHLTAKFHHSTFNCSEVIVRTDKLTDRRHWKHPPHFATLRRWVINVVHYLYMTDMYTWKLDTPESYCITAPQSQYAICVLNDYLTKLITTTNYFLKQ